MGNPATCPKCGAAAVDVVICPVCDFIVDTSFLGDDFLNQPTGEVQQVARKRSDFGGEAMIIGDLNDEQADFDSFVGERSGSFLFAETGDGARIIEPAPVYMDRSTQAMLEAPAVLAVKSTNAVLSPFEQHVVSFIDGRRPVERIRHKANLSMADIKIALAMLADRGMLTLVGTARAPTLRAHLAGELDSDEGFLPDLDNDDPKTLPFDMPVPPVKNDPLVEDTLPIPDDLEVELHSSDLDSDVDVTTPMRGAAPPLPPPQPSVLPSLPSMPPMPAVPAIPTIEIPPLPTYSPPPQPSPTATPAPALAVRLPMAPTPAPMRVPMAPTPVRVPMAPTPGPIPAVALPVTATPAPWTPPSPPPSPPTTPRDPVAHAKAMTLYEMAMTDLRAGKKVRAHMYAKLAKETCADEPLINALLANWNTAESLAKQETPEQRLFAEAQKAEEAGDYAGAIALLQKAIAENGAAAELHNRLGVIMATRLCDYTRASGALMRAVELEPGNVVYRSNLGKVFKMSEGKNVGALIADSSTVKMPTEAPKPKSMLDRLKHRVGR